MIYNCYEFPLFLAHPEGRRGVRLAVWQGRGTSGARFSRKRELGIAQGSDSGTRNYLVLGLNRSTDPQLPPRAGFFSSKWPLGMPRGGGTSNPGLFGLDGAPGGHFA